MLMLLLHHADRAHISCRHERMHIRTALGYVLAVTSHAAATAVAVFTVLHVCYWFCLPH